MTHRLRVRPGQATVEFALVLPLVVVCAAVIVVAVVAGLRVLALADLARDAARAATVADEPCHAAAVVVDARAALRCEVDHLPSGQARMVRIHLTDRMGMPGIIGDWVAALAPRAGAMMLVEPPPALG